ncbi:MAG: hypothetical protein WC849_00635 [Candidatus Paceibacterota bacterium]
MNKYLITYDLKNKNIRNYESLYSAIKKLGPWWHYLDSTWIIKTNLNSQQIWSYLGNHIITNDYLLIVKIESKDRWGWLSQDAWTWLDS